MKGKMKKLEKKEKDKQRSTRRNHKTLYRYRHIIAGHWFNKKNKQNKSIKRKGGPKKRRA